MRTRKLVLAQRVEGEHARGCEHEREARERRLVRVADGFGVCVGGRAHAALAHGVGVSGIDAYDGLDGQRVLKDEGEEDLKVEEELA